MTKKKGASFWASPPFFNTKIPMIDYISITKHLNKDSPFLGHCNQTASFSSGLQCYHVQGCEKLRLLWNPTISLLSIAGSIMYFWQGHNFTCYKGEFVEAVDYLQELLQVGLWDSVLEAFEFGAIMEVEHKPALYIKNHHAREGVRLTENEKGQDKGSFKWWEDSTEKLKLYDARKNIIQKQGLQRRKIIEQAGWNPESQYLKFETKFRKPALLNSGSDLMLEELLNPNRYNELKMILQRQYELLEPMKTLVLPKDKKQLTSADIVLLAYVEGFINAFGGSPSEAQKALYKRINLIPDEILSKADKDSRKRQIKALFAKVQESEASQWDLTDKLAAALASDNWQRPDNNSQKEQI